MTPHKFHKSSFRPHLWMGAERPPMIALMLVCIGLVLVSFSLVATAVSAALWFTIHPLLIWLAKKDPCLISVYFRNTQYPKHIPRFTTPFRKAPGYAVVREPKYLTR